MARILDLFVPVHSLERLMKLAKERLVHEGKEPTDLDSYRLAAKLRREELKELYAKRNADPTRK